MKRLTLKQEDIYIGNLILVNETHPLQHEQKESNLVCCLTEYPKILLKKKAATMLTEIFHILGCTHEIVPVSGYRALQEQKTIYDTSIKENGREFTGKFVAIPGCSEHQTGLAIDLAERKAEIDFLRPDFPYTGICGRFRKIASKHGFVERYPSDGEHITKIAPEPWHFRYVGYPHSELMNQKNLTLEEYTVFLKNFPYEGPHIRILSNDEEFEIFYVQIPIKKSITIPIEDNTSYQISGNNEDGCIVTLWRNLV